MRTIITITFLFFLTACGGGSGGGSNSNSGGDIPNAPVNPQTPTVDVTGNWEGSFTSANQSHSLRLNLSQSNSNLSGTYEDISYGYSGTISGVVSGNSVYFNAIPNSCGNKTLKGFGTVCNNTMSFRFKGADCNAEYDSNGIVELFSSYAGNWVYSGLSQGNNGNIYHIDSQLSLVKASNGNYSGNISVKDTTTNSVISAQIANVPISTYVSYGSDNVTFTNITGIFASYTTMTGNINSNCCVPPRILDGVWKFGGALELPAVYKRLTCE